ncbi:phosphoserine phosphatase SerB [Paracoccus cavernae]|uniref:phosphoserine phosphatase SerB n=1 Tax=Paracoccus cavernae TaxID=1571207 RepID=UPI0035F23538
MFTATLLVDPTRANLTETSVERLRTQWEGSEIRWLAPDVAVEFDLASMPADRWARWDELQSESTDLVVQKASGRKKKLLLADMDSTMIQQECIDELADFAGVGAKVSEITTRAMNGELNFASALTQRIALLRGLPVGTIQKVIDERISFMPGAQALLKTMRINGGYAALVSSGFTAFSGYVAEALGFNEHRANELLSENGRLTGVPADPIRGGEAKVCAFHDLSSRLGLTAEEVMAVGDGANDLGMLALAGSGVALHAKPAVAAQCDIRINHGDLTALLYIQGYTLSDFA